MTMDILKAATITSIIEPELLKFDKEGIKIAKEDYGACLLGSINLTTLIRDPFTAEAHLDVVDDGLRVGGEALGCCGVRHALRLCPVNTPCQYSSAQNRRES